MWHTVLISLHAAAGVLAFAAGTAALPAGRFFAVYRWSLVAMLAFLLGAIAVTAAELDAGTAVAFGALVALALAMVWRSGRAARLLPASTGGPTAGYVEHLGFGLVGLFDAFWVVTLLRAGLAGWVVAAVGVGIAVTGHLLLRHAAARLSGAATASRAVTRT